MEIYKFKPEISQNSKSIIQKLSKRSDDNKDPAKFMPLHNIERQKL